jgi:hypothetical protein
MVFIKVVFGTSSAGLESPARGSHGEICSLRGAAARLSGGVTVTVGP